MSIVKKEQSVAHVWIFFLLYVMKEIDKKIHNPIAARHNRTLNAIPIFNTSGAMAHSKM
jgi:hypothetical protein